MVRQKTLIAMNLSNTANGHDNN